MVEVYSNQKNCGESIIKAFVEEKKHHVLLLAQMQMGKSGTYWYTILTILFNNIQGIENVVLMSGNRETELHQQVLEDKKNYIKWFFQQKHIVDAVSSTTELKILKKLFMRNIAIVWGGQLNRKRNNQFELLNNTLIVWDESHYAQSKKNAPDIFFKNNNIEMLVNGSSSVKDRNILLLTVSATPFSELIVNSFDDRTLHKVVKLIPDTNYFGLEHYTKNGLVNGSFVICEDTLDHFKQIILKHVDPKDPKYIIVRVTDNKNKSKFIINVCKQLNIDYKSYNSISKEIELSEMINKPIKPTVVIISGMLRMGKVIQKEHISMVFEESTKNLTRKVDTGFQGLLGRVCGYSKSNQGFNITVYVEESVIEEIHQYIENYESDKISFCCNAMNTSSTNNPKTKILRKYNIFEIPMQDDFLTEKKNVSKSKVFKWLKKNDITLDMTEEVSNQFSMLLDNNNTVFQSKNLTLKSNSRLLKFLNNDNKHTHCIPENVCYIMNTDTQIWMVFNENKIDIENITISIPNTNNVFVSNKCVFKI